MQPTWKVSQFYLVHTAESDGCKDGMTEFRIYFDSL